MTRGAGNLSMAEKVEEKSALLTEPDYMFDREEKQLINRHELAASKRLYRIGRRIQDIVFSALALVVLSPLMLLTALAIVIDDPKGGPIFSQTRCGKDGKEFRFYKFRSMCVDAEKILPDLLDRNEMDGPAFKMAGDPRITRVGRFIRRSSIDELPQLINILKGDMSIVGPRPPLPQEVAKYNAYQRQRLYVVPGLTCYWQILPHRNKVSFDEWVNLDIRYIQERSFLLDWKIIFCTIRAILCGYGE